MLKIEHLSFGYGDKLILNEVSFSASLGEIIALIGVSGSGKTTLFRLISGHLVPLSGSIAVEGETTYMRQEDLLLPWRTVMENLLLFSELGRRSQDKIGLRAEAEQLLERLSLGTIENDYPDTLSGGMRQRVALARSLLQKRPLMLLDEPFASLDVILREELYVLMREIRDLYGKTVVMVTHDFRDAIALADRILVLGSGTIVANHLVTPQLRSHPTPLIQKIREDLLSHFLERL